MAQEKVAETVPQAKPQSEAVASKPVPRLSVVVSDQASKPSVACRSPLDVFGIVGRELSQADRETFIVLHLDGKSRLLAKETIAVGSQSAAIVHPREVFKGAVLNGSAAIVCAHNHPSGDPTPSQEDREITARLKEAGELMGIVLHDHIIIGKPAGDYYSFAEAGALTTPINKSQKPEIKAECQCKSALSDIYERLDCARKKIDFFGCMDWESLNQNDDAQSGHYYLLRGLSNEIKEIGEEIWGVRLGAKGEN